MWFYNFNIEEFMEIVGDNYLSDGGLEVRLLENGLIGVELNDLCDYFDIEPEELHPKEEPV